MMGRYGFIYAFLFRKKNIFIKHRNSCNFYKNITYWYFYKLSYLLFRYHTTELLIYDYFVK